jgi:hypothetical protein
MNEQRYGVLQELYFVNWFISCWIENVFMHISVNSVAALVYRSSPIWWFFSVSSLYAFPKSYTDFGII